MVLFTRGASSRLRFDPEHCAEALVDFGVETVVRPNEPDYCARAFTDRLHNMPLRRGRRLDSGAGATGLRLRTGPRLRRLVAGEGARRARDPVTPRRAAGARDVRHVAAMRLFPSTAKRGER
jgi:hypothetical protein